MNEKDKEKQIKALEELTRLDEELGLYNITNTLIKENLPPREMGWGKGKDE